MILNVILEHKNDMRHVDVRMQAHRTHKFSIEHTNVGLTHARPIIVSQIPIYMHASEICSVPLVFAAIFHQKNVILITFIG